jgi:phospholipase/carboxylesterase
VTAATLVARHAPAAPGAPTLLALHGRGSHETDLIGLGEALGGGIGILAPRGPLEQPPGYAWFRNAGIGNAVPESLAECLRVTGDWLAGAIAELGLEGPLTAVGFSNGGMMAGALAATRPDLVGDVALLSSSYALPSETYAGGGLRGRRVLAVGGEDDPFLPPEAARAGIAAYRAAGAEVTALTRPGGHGVGPEEIAALRDWLGIA